MCFLGTAIVHDEKIATAPDGIRLLCFLLQLLPSGELQTEPSRMCKREEKTPETRWIIALPRRSNKFSGFLRG